MFTVSVTTSFCASHALTLPDSSVEPLHEHDWQVSVELAAQELNASGFVMDFHVLQAAIDKTIKPLNDVRLEDVGYFDPTKRNASAEEVARFIYDNIAPEMPDNVELVAVEVTEAADCRAKYSK